MVGAFFVPLPPCSNTWPATSRRGQLTPRMRASRHTASRNVSLTVCVWPGGMGAAGRLHRHHVRRAGRRGGLIDERRARRGEAGDGAGDWPVFFTSTFIRTVLVCGSYEAFFGSTYEN